jgi:hypothetical protein
MLQALQYAAVADPTAMKELALDLCEVELSPRDPHARCTARDRAARGMVRLRARFNNDVPNFPTPKNIDGPAFIPREEPNEEGAYWINEVGIWKLALDAMNEPGRTLRADSGHV